MKKVTGGRLIRTGVLSLLTLVSLSLAAVWLWPVPRPETVIPATRYVQLNSHGGQEDAYQAVLQGHISLSGGENQRAPVLRAAQSQTLRQFSLSRGGATFDTRTLEAVREVTLEAVVRAGTGQTVLVYGSQVSFNTTSPLNPRLWQTPPAYVEIPTQPDLAAVHPYTVTVSLPAAAVARGGFTRLMFRLASEGRPPPDSFVTGLPGEGVVLGELKLRIKP